MAFLAFFLQATIHLRDSSHRSRELRAPAHEEHQCGELTKNLTSNKRIYSSEPIPTALGCSFGGTAGGTHSHIPLVGHQVCESEGVIEKKLVP